MISIKRTYSLDNILRSLLVRTILDFRCQQLLTFVQDLSNHLIWLCHYQKTHCHCSRLITAFRCTLDNIACCYQLLVKPSKSYNMVSSLDKDSQVNSGAWSRQLESWHYCELVRGRRQQLSSLSPSPQLSQAVPTAWPALASCCQQQLPGSSI